MAKGVNKVFLLGRLGKDPEMRATQGGTTVVELYASDLGPAEGRPGQNWQDHIAEWHNLVAFSAHRGDRPRLLQERFADFCRRQDSDAQSWEDKKGQKKYRTGDSGERTEPAGQQGRRWRRGRRCSYSRSSSSSQAASAPVAGAHDYPDQGITDDDIPF